ncbi:MAG TPA: antitoxin [Acidothermales bacterium]
MTDVLIRDVPEDVIAAIDARAAGLGLSRNEYLRRRLQQESRHGGQAATTIEDLRRLRTLFADLEDPEVMAGAWS